MSSPFQNLEQRNIQLAIIGFLTLAGVMSGHLLLETARDSLFLSSISASNLPIVYLIIAGITFGITRIEERLDQLGRPAIALSSWMVVGAVANALFATFIQEFGKLGLYALYVWGGTLVTLTVIQFWSILGDLTTIRDARNLFSVVGAGGLVGASVGAGLATLILQFTEAHSLLYISAGLFALSATGPIALSRLGTEQDGESVPEETSSESKELSDILSEISSRPYAVQIVGLLFVASAGATLGDFIFKFTAAETLSESQLGPFFAYVYLGLNLSALGIQLFGVEPVLRYGSVSGALSILPALFLTGGAAFVIGSPLVAAILIKGADGSLKHSLNKTAQELLYVPFSKSFRAIFKPFSSIVGKRGGQATASLAILGASYLNAPDEVFAGALVAVAGFWIWIAFHLRQKYLNVFRQTLSDSLDAAPKELPEFDLESFEGLLTALNSSDDGVVVRALESLETEGKGALVPKFLLYHPSPDVVARALLVFAKHDVQDYRDVAIRVFDHSPPRIRALITAIIAETESRDWLESIKKNDSSEFFRDVAHLESERLTKDSKEALIHLENMIHTTKGENQIALLEILRLQPWPDVSGKLMELFEQTQNHRVKRQVIDVFEAWQAPSSIEPLIDKLCNRQFRDRVTDALVAHGEPALDILESRLYRETNRSVRVRIPHAIGRFEHQRAADILARHVGNENDGMVRYRIVRELERLKHDCDQVYIPQNPVQAAVEEQIDICYLYVNWELSLARRPEPLEGIETRGDTLLAEMLQDKRQKAVEVLLRLISLKFPTEDFRPIRRGLRYGDEIERASSRELVENLLPRRLKGPVVGLIESDNTEAIWEQRSHFGGQQLLDCKQVLETFIQGSSEKLRELAAFHAGELGAKSLLGPLREASERRQIDSSVLPDVINSLSQDHPKQ
jgi:AAA family ATP:ADP antiporter